MSNKDKKNISPVKEKSRPKTAFSKPKTKKITKPKTDNDYIKFLEDEHAHDLAKVFYKEWELIKAREIIKQYEEEYISAMQSLKKKKGGIFSIKEIVSQFEAEHNKSLSLLFLSESQKLVLEELNNKLTGAAIIHGKDLRMAENVQRNLLQKTPPVTENFDIAFHYQPAASVSGDFYDFYVDEKNLLTGVIIADVSGHGIASSLLTSLAKPIFFRLFHKHGKQPLGKILEIINNHIIKETAGVDNYLTSIILKFNENTVEYVNAAHPDIIIKKSNTNESGRFIIDTKGSMMGLEILNGAFTSRKFELQTGDVILLYTDGLSESKNSAEEDFGESGIINALNNTTHGNTAKEILDELTRSLKEHTEEKPVKDDLTAIVIKKK